MVGTIGSTLDSSARSEIHRVDRSPLFWRLPALQPLSGTIRADLGHLGDQEQDSSSKDSGKGV